MLRDNYEQNLALANAAAQRPVAAARARGLDAHASSGRGCSTASSRACRPARRCAARLERGEGLTAPELSVLLAYTKIVLADELLDTDLPDDPYLRTRPVRLLPDADARRLPRPRSRDHPLRREIIVTQVVNDLVNGAGMTFFHRLAGGDRRDAPAELTRANFVAREIFGSLPLRDEINDLRQRARRRRADPDAARDAHPGRAGLAVAGQQPPPAAGQRGARSTTSAWPVQQVMAALPDAADRARAAGATSSGATRWSTQGVPEDLATRVAVLPPAYMLLGHRRDRRPRRRSTRSRSPGCTSRSASGSGCPTLVARILALPRDDRWQTMARAALRDDLHAVHAQLTAQVLRRHRSDDAGAGPDRGVGGRRRRRGRPRGRATLEEICADDARRPGPDVGRPARRARAARQLTADHRAAGGTRRGPMTRARPARWSRPESRGGRSRGHGFQGRRANLTRSGT